jgi:flagellin
MSLGILTNVSGLAAQRSLNEASRMMETSMERLTTGKRINGAGDDAAGLATAMRMESQIRSLDMAAKNAVDGQAMVQTIEASLEEVDAMLQRMREISVQASNGTTSAADRIYLDAEKDALINEIDRIQSDVKFNGTRLFDGNLSTTFQVGAEKGDTIAVTQANIASSSLGGFQVDSGSGINTAAAATLAAANDVAAGNDLTITNNVTGATASADAAAGDSAKLMAGKVNALAGTTGVTATADNKYIVTTTETTGAITLTIGGGGGTASTGSVTVTSTGFQALVDAINADTATTGVSAALKSASEMFLIEADGDDITLLRTDSTTHELDIDGAETDDTASGGTIVTLQSSTANEAVRLKGRLVFNSSDDFKVVDAGTQSNGFLGSGTENAEVDKISDVDLSTITLASNSIAKIDGAIEKVAQMRSNLGAIDNRLTHTATNLAVQSEATSAARSKIIDADYAVESAELAKAQVLMQAGTAMLAQANAAPQMVLQLLQ